MRRKVLAQSVRHAVEILEARMLLSSTLAAAAGSANITGVVYNDVNGNGIRDAGEPAVTDATVTIQQIGVVYAPGAAPTVQTDSGGGFYFTGLANGLYDVNVAAQDGYAQDAPGTTFVAVSANDTASVAVGETNAGGGGSGTATITGTVFNDLDQSGVYNPATEDFLAGDTVYLDYNGSGVFAPNDPFTVTNNIGQYTFNVAPGSYQVRVVPRPGFTQDAPGYSQVTVYSDQTAGQNIGENNTGVITGTVFIDSNGNGAQDTGELPVAGETVFLDENFNGVFDQGSINPITDQLVGGEPFAVTDPNGHYEFTGLAPGAYRLVIQSSTGLIQDAPGYIDLTIAASQTLVQNIGEGIASSVSGTVFDDHNGNGTLDPGDPGLPNQLVFIDTNNNGVYDKTGVGGDGYPIFGPTTTYTLPFSAMLTLDNQTAPAVNLNIGDTAELTLVAGGTTTLTNLAASDVPVPTGQSDPARGTGPAGTIVGVGLLLADLTLTPFGATAATVDITDQNDASGGGGLGNPGDITGTVVGVDAAANTITLQADDGTITTYTLATGATVTLDGSPSALSALTQTVTVQAAEPAAVTDVNGNFTIANLGPGNYVARVFDPQGVTPTGPATAMHSLTFTVTSDETITNQDFGFQTPDLAATIVHFPTTPTLTAVKKRASVRVTNVGSLPADGLAGVTLWAQTSGGPVVPDTAYIIGTVPGHPVKLQPGQSRTFNVVFAYPTQLQENSYYVSAQVVSTVHDNNSANDFSPPFGPVQVGPPHIDLSLAYQTVPIVAMAPGQSTVIPLVVTNLGNVTTTGAIEFRIYTTTTAAIEPTDVAVQTSAFKGVHIKPGQSKVFDLTLPYPGQNLGLRFIDTTVDSGDPLGEMNLLNNVAIPASPTRFD